MKEIDVVYFLLFQCLLGLTDAEVVLNFNKQSNQHNDSNFRFIYHATCEYNNAVYTIGEFKLSKCVTCNCDGVTGRVTCVTRNCPPVKNCIRYFNVPSRCCPICIDYGCTYDKKLYTPGSLIKPDACTRCYCPWKTTNNDIDDVTCMSLQCKPARCVDARTPVGKCCPVCPNGEYTIHLSLISLHAAYPKVSP